MESQISIKTMSYLLHIKRRLDLRHILLDIPLERGNVDGLANGSCHISDCGLPGGSLQTHPRDVQRILKQELENGKCAFLSLSFPNHPTAVNRGSTSLARST